MIPKIIHYCWFGGNEKPKLVSDCIESWKKYCPNFEIIEWNESNFDYSSCRYAAEAYEARKWAFVSDYARLCVLNRFGGLYLDTDMEMLKPVDELLESCNGILSFEAKDFVCLGVIGANKSSPLLQEFIDEYEQIGFLNPDGTYQMVTNVRRFRKYLTREGLKNNGKKQTVAGFTIFPQKYFFPNTFGMLFNKPPRSAYTLDHANASWKDKSVPDNKAKALRAYFVNKARNVFGTDRIERFRDKKA